MDKETWDKLVSARKSWVGWDLKRLKREFGEPSYSRDEGEWLGFQMDGYRVTVHMVKGKVLSADVWADH
jgi:hypothetical protein